MTIERNPHFIPFRRKQPEDPHPSELTREERAYIEECAQSGTAPRFRLVKKLLRLSDERHDVALILYSRIRDALEALDAGELGRCRDVLSGGNELT